MRLIKSKLGPVVSPTTKYPWYHSICSLRVRSLTTLNWLSVMCKTFIQYSSVYFPLFCSFTFFSHCLLHPCISQLSFTISYILYLNPSLNSSSFMHKTFIQYSLVDSPHISHFTS